MFDNAVANKFNVVVLLMYDTSVNKTSAIKMKEILIKN